MAKEFDVSQYRLLEAILKLPFGPGNRAGKEDSEAD